jgi:hypothetical protein
MRQVLYESARPSHSCTMSCAMPENKEKSESDTSSNTKRVAAAPSKPKRWRPSNTLRSVLMVSVGFIAFVIVSGFVLYMPIMYGDAIENFGIVMMLTVPVIAAVAFRVALDSWLDAD